MTSVNVTTVNNTVEVTTEGRTTVVQTPQTTVVTATTVGPQGPSGGTGTLVGLLDVDAAGRVDGSVLVYDGTSAKFVAGPLNTKLTLADGGNF